MGLGKIGGWDFGLKRSGKTFLFEKNVYE